jgi:hypothetical protein
MRMVGILLAVNPRTELTNILHFSIEEANTAEEKIEWNIKSIWNRQSNNF